MAKIRHLPRSTEAPEGGVDVANVNTAGWTQEEYRARLAAMSDEALFEEAKKYIWLSAYANNNPRSAYHWMCDYTYDEANNRGKADIYSKAHKAVMKAEGYGSDDEEEAEG